MITDQETATLADLMRRLLPEEYGFIVCVVPLPEKGKGYQGGARVIADLPPAVALEALKHCTATVRKSMAAGVEALLLPGMGTEPEA